MYFLRVLIAIDQLVNTIFGGMPDETISAKLWRLRDRQPYKTLRYIVDALFWFDKDHCRTSYESEIKKTQLPSNYRD